MIIASFSSWMIKAEKKYVLGLMFRIFLGNK